MVIGTVHAVKSIVLLRCKSSNNIITKLHFACSLRRAVAGSIPWLWSFPSDLYSMESTISRISTTALISVVGQSLGGVWVHECQDHSDWFANAAYQFIGQNRPGDQHRGPICIRLHAKTTRGSYCTRASLTCLYYRSSCSFRLLYCNHLQAMSKGHQNLK